MEMNPEQQLVIEHHHGPLRVGAVAGSGKTTALVERVAYLIEKRHVSPDKILMITFSRMAREEMKKRIDKRLPGANAGRCARTFHSIGLRIFQTEGDPDGRFALDTSGIMYLRAAERAYKAMRIEPEKKAIALMASIVKNNLLGNNEALRRLGRVDPRIYSAATAAAKDATVSADEVREAFYRTEHIRSVDGVDFKGKRQRFVTFDDMIYQSAMLLRKKDVRARWAERWSYILQDECQDENEAQACIAEALASKTRNYMIVGDPAQCHPPGVMIETGPRAEDCAPVEELWEQQEGAQVTVRGWNRNAQKMVGGRRATLGSRHYCGEMIDMHIDMQLGSPHTRTVPMTPNHRVLCRWWDRTVDTCITYLMYREGFGFRVGWCKLFASRKEGDHQFHLGYRARNEKAERVWILRTHDDRTDASVYESIVAMHYGIPTAPFEPVHGAKHLTRSAVEQIFRAYRESDPTHARGGSCLLDHGRHFQYPFYPFNRKPGTRYSRSTYFEVFASNLEPNLMAVPLADMKGKRAWTPISRVERRHYSGPVYSLNVEKDHSYAANGIVVLNSVFGWRGSKPERMLQFDKDWHGAKTVVMHRNYRSGIEIVDVANNIMGHMPARTVITDDFGDAKLMGCERQTHAHVSMHVFDTPTDEAEAVAENIEAHASSGLKYQDQAVLLRMNRMTLDVEVAMARRRIPYRLVSGRSFFTMPEARVLLGYLQVMLNRADDEAFKACIGNPRRKLGKAFIAKVAEEHDMVKRNWVATVKKVLPHVKPYQARMAKEWIRFIEERRQQADATTEPEKVLATLRSALELDDFFQRESSDADDDASNDNLDAVLDFAAHFATCGDLLDVVENVAKHRSAHSRKQNAVRVSTVHKAKGLEWPVVYLIQLSGGQFPAGGDNSDLHEERRCFYVACTRAQDELWMSRSIETKHDNKSPTSRFVDEAEVKELPAKAFKPGRRIDLMKVGTQIGLGL